MAKSNPYILPVGIVVVSAGLIAFFTRKASAADIPIAPPTQDDPEQPAKPTGGGGGAGGAAKSNPPVAFPFASTGQAKIAENAEAGLVHAEWMAAVNEVMIENGEEAAGPSEGTIDEAKERLGVSGNVASWLASRAYYKLYQTGKIPPASERKSGWKPYVDSWIRLHDFLKTMPWV